jgi:hypothetical protein
VAAAAGDDDEEALAARRTEREVAPSAADRVCWFDAPAEAPVEDPESALPTAGEARAIAIPAPNATANPPTRPTYLAQLIYVPFAAAPLPLRLDYTLEPEVGGIDNAAGITCPLVWIDDVATRA